MRALQLFYSVVQKILLEKESRIKIKLNLNCFYCFFGIFKKNWNSQFFSKKKNFVWWSEDPRADPDPADPTGQQRILFENQAKQNEEKWCNIKNFTPDILYTRKCKICLQNAIFLSFEKFEQAADPLRTAAD